MRVSREQVAAASAAVKARKGAEELRRFVVLSSAEVIETEGNQVHLMYEELVNESEGGRQPIHRVTDEGIA
jgi:hypothetical protein